MQSCPGDSWSQAAWQGQRRVGGTVRLLSMVRWYLEDETRVLVLGSNHESPSAGAESNCAGLIELIQRKEGLEGRV